MIIKYHRRAIWTILIMIFLVIFKLVLSIILDVPIVSSDSWRWLLNIVDAIVLLSLPFVIIGGLFMAPIWYGMAKGYPAGSTLSTLFGFMGIFKLLSLPDKSPSAATIETTPKVS